jgi:hypothetical protein
MNTLNKGGRMEAVATTVIGLVGGLALSALLWHFTTHRITPKIRFSSEISKRYSDRGDAHYELRIYNSAKKRGAVDISISCALCTHGIKMYQYSPGTSRVILPIPINNPKIARLNPSDGYRTIRLDPISAIENATEIHQVTLMLKRLEKDDNHLLERLLLRGESAYIEIDILAYDEWSGARKHFRSPRYTLDQIIHGRFDGFRVKRLPRPKFLTRAGKSTKPEKSPKRGGDKKTTDKSCLKKTLKGMHLLVTLLMLAKSRNWLKQFFISQINKLKAFIQKPSIKHRSRLASSKKDLTILSKFSRLMIKGFKR